MSSSLAARRIKDRGGAGAKTTALKPTNAIAEVREKPSAGKENPRSVSASRTRAAPRKSAVPSRGPERATGEALSAAAKDGDPRVRWSTSSVPRGKLSNPSDFTKFLGDRVSRASLADRSAKGFPRASAAEVEVPNLTRNANGFKAHERGQLKKSSTSLNSKAESKKTQLECLGASEPSKNVDLNSREKEIIGTNVRVLADCEEMVSVMSNLESISVKCANDLSVKGVFVLTNGSENTRLSEDRNSGSFDDEKATNRIGGFSTSEVRSCLNLNSQQKSGKSADSARTVDNCSDVIPNDSNLSGKVEKCSNGVGVAENFRAEGVQEENRGSQVVNKYPSRLHEKLAYLESKVKRIASDIKKTKEMLDMNDPDASKSALLDIQDKISGIEKAMGNVVDGSKSKPGVAETFESDGFYGKQSVRNQGTEDANVKNASKSVDCSELEDRLFPHQKLLRIRKSISNLTGKSDSLKTSILEIKGNVLKKDRSLSPTEESQIALEFLASLDKKESLINLGDGQGELVRAAVQQTGVERNAKLGGVSREVISTKHEDIELTADENLEDFDDRENKASMIVREEAEDSSVDQLREIGRKSSTGGWFVSEGESVLLAHDDGSCSFYDVVNSDEKSVYNPPVRVSNNLWGDCWLVRAVGSDGCSGKFVIAASAGNTLDSGFCSWDFYTKDCRAFRVEDGAPKPATILAPISNRSSCRRDSVSTSIISGNKQWWYKPSGPLLVSTASGQKTVSIYDIRDGDLVMSWQVQRPVLTMDYASPLQWRDRGKVVVAETESVSLWDVNSLSPRSLLSTSSSGRRISALHVNNTEAELGGGIRRRVSSSEAEGNDGVFCTQETINVLDFRVPSGVGLKIAKHGFNSHSIFSHKDSIFIGSSEVRTSARPLSRSLVQHFSLRKGKLVGMYALPESNAHIHHLSITQVWGDSNLVMAICGMGLFVFDAHNDETQPVSVHHQSSREVREVIGPDDLYSPSFDYLGSRALVISRDRPALWRYLS